MTNFDPVEICGVSADEGVGFAVTEPAGIIASKVAANRPWDRRALPYLDSLRDEIERNP